MAYLTVVALISQSVLWYSILDTNAINVVAISAIDTASIAVIIFYHTIVGIFMVKWVAVDFG